MKNVKAILARILLLVLVAALCPLNALADAPGDALVQVIYASPEGNFGAQQVRVSPTSNVVSPDPAYVPAGYTPVQASPVKLIFNTMGQPVPSVIFFTYQRTAATTSVKVNYATVNGVFASNYVTVTPNNNIIYPDAAMVPAGYQPLSPNPAVILFDPSGKPVQTEVTFYYYVQQSSTLPGNGNTGNTGSTGSTMTAEQIIAGWQMPGKIVTFGSYEQDGNETNGKEPMEWIAMRSQLGRVLLVSRYAIHSRPYNSEWKAVSWKDCTLRSWLNSTFYKSCFTAAQQEAIVTSELKTAYAGTTVTTQDKVFLIDANEAKHMSKDLILCKPTQYAKNRSTATSNGYCYWWLRDTTNRKSDANRVEPNGEVAEYGANTNATGVGVRPAIWVDLVKGFGK